MEYVPSEAVCALNDRPVATLFAETVALGTAWPAESLTLPWRVYVCANADMAVTPQQNRNARVASANIPFLIDMYVSPDRRAGGDSFKHSDEVEYAALTGQLEGWNRMREMKILSSALEVKDAEWECHASDRGTPRCFEFQPLRTRAGGYSARSTVVTGFRSTTVVSWRWLASSSKRAR